MSTRPVVCRPAATALPLVVGLAMVVTTARAADWYVDTNHAAASDTNPGTEAQPWKTIQRAANAATAGDTVFVKEGVYREWVNVPSSGTAAEPIVFRAYPGDRPILDGTGVDVPDWSALFRVDGKQHVTLEGFEVRSVQSSTAYLVLVQNSAQVAIRDCVIHGNNLGAVCESSTSATCRSGVFFSDCTGGLIEQNEVYDTGRNAIHLTDSNDVLIVRNYVHDNPHHNAVNIFPKTTDAQTIHRGNHIAYNVLTGSSNGIYLRYEADNEIHDNLIFDNEKAGVMLAPASASGVDNYVFQANTKVYNNTIVGNGGNGVQSSNGTHFAIKNNIIADNGTYAIYLSSSASSGHDIDYNLYFPAPRFGHDGADHTALSAWQAATGFDAHGLESDPRFVDAGGGDFSLAADSPAVDSGLDLSGDGITEDIAGIPRPQGAGFDLGAFELCEGDCAAGGSGQGGGGEGGTATGGVDGGAGGAGEGAGSTTAPASAIAEDDAGCGCRAGAGTARSRPALWTLLLALVGSRRRRRRQ